MKRHLILRASGNQNIYSEPKNEKQGKNGRKRIRTKNRKGKAIKKNKINGGREWGSVRRKWKVYT